jgi:Flp/Fap pilin component
LALCPPLQHDRSGVTAIEYAMIAAFIAILVVAVLLVVGTSGAQHVYAGQQRILIRHRAAGRVPRRLSDGQKGCIPAAGAYRHARGGAVMIAGWQLVPNHPTQAAFLGVRPPMDAVIERLYTGYPLERGPKRRSKRNLHNL